jgi:hypothetical protein
MFWFRNAVQPLEAGFAASGGSSAAPVVLRP